MDLILQRPRGYNQGGFHTKKSPTLSSNAREWNNMVIQLNPSKESGGVQPCQQNRVYSPAGKSPALMAEMSCGTHAILEHTGINVLGNTTTTGITVRQDVFMTRQANRHPYAAKPGVSAVKRDFISTIHVSAVLPLPSAHVCRRYPIGTGGIARKHSSTRCLVTDGR